MTGQPETVVAIMSAITRQMILVHAINVGELHSAGPVPDEGAVPQSSKEHGESTACDPKLLNDGRKWR